MSTLNFLVIGDSEAGKSSFIKNFTTSELARLLDISGRGQTTRSNGIYEFTSDKNINNNVEVYFYSKDEFVNKNFEKIINKNNLQPEYIKTNNDLKEIYVNDESPSIDYDKWYDKNKSEISKLCGYDFISDEFIKLTELDIDIEETFLLSTEFENVSSYPQFEDVIKEKLKFVYDMIKANIDKLVSKFIIENNEDEDSQKDIKNLKFNLNDDTKLLFTLCIKQTKQVEREKNDCNIITISGLVKKTKVKMKLDSLYDDICKSIGVDSISFIDTYGLDHEASNGSIDIEKIKERLKQVLNYEFKEIESVIFITPMVGKAAGTNERFQALIEAKRSIFPQIIYTKFDEYLEDELDRDLCEIELCELDKVIVEFQKGNKNPIKDSFYKILEEYYSDDVALYRKNIILSNIAYYMGAYEKKVDTISAKKFNLHYFKKIIMNIFQKNNMGIDFNFDSTYNFIKELEKSMKTNKTKIESKYINMLNVAQKQLAISYENAYFNTRQAFWKRIRSNMFGFYNNLDLRRILIEQFDELLAKDASEHKDDNLGNYIVNEYFIKRRLNIFIRECINAFSEFYFCAGCMPCDALMPDKCEMSKMCNSTYRIGGRKHRKDNCYQCSKGIKIGSRQMSRYCENTNIWGIGLLDRTYGQENECNSRCFWLDLFDCWENCNKQSISLNKICNVDSFIEVFISFCKEKYEKAQNNLANIQYLNSYEVNEKNEDEIDSKLNYEILSSISQNVILLTEGKTDKVHIESAWKKIRKTEFPFFICDAGGANKLESFMKSYPVDLFKNKTIIALFDYDKKGIKIYRSINPKNSKDHVKELKEENRSCYVIILPHKDKKLEEYEAGEIEFLYKIDFLNKLGVIQKRNINAINELEYVKTNNQYLNYTEYREVKDLCYFEPIDSKKTYFAEYVAKNIETIEFEKFQGFEVLFKLLDDILARISIGN